jgi:hypothetical protein
VARLLSDTSWETDCSADQSGCHDHKKIRPRPPIRVGRITVDCTPVTFRTPGQAVNVLSCPVTEVLSVPVTRTVNVQVPIGFGCFLCLPITETVTVPVETTVNLPPVLTPAPVIVCPPTGVAGLPCG